MAVRGEGYRVVLGWISIVYNSLMLIIGHILVYQRRNLQPVKTWNPWLLASFLWHLPLRFAFLELREIGVLRVRCDVLVLMHTLAFWSMAMPTSLTFYRLVLISAFEQRKIDFAKSHLHTALGATVGRGAIAAAMASGGDTVPSTPVAAAEPVAIEPPLPAPASATAGSTGTGTGTSGGSTLAHPRSPHRHPTDMTLQQFQDSSVQSMIRFAVLDCVLTAVSCIIFFLLDKDMVWSTIECGDYNHGLYLVLINFGIASMCGLPILRMTLRHRASIVEVFGLRRSYVILMSYCFALCIPTMLILLLDPDENFDRDIFDPWWFVASAAAVADIHIVLWPCLQTWSWRAGRRPATAEKRDQVIPVTAIDGLEERDGTRIGDDGGGGGGGGGVSQMYQPTGEPGGAASVVGTAAGDFAAKKKALASGHHMRASIQSVHDRFGIALCKILLDPVAYQTFLTYSQGEFNSESVLFWTAAEAFRSAPTVTGAARLYSSFFSPAAPMPLNVPAELQRQITADVDALFVAVATAAELGQPEPIPSEELFDSAQREVFVMLRNDVFPRFRTSAAGQPFVPFWSDEVPFSALNRDSLALNVSGAAGFGERKSSPVAGENNAAVDDAPPPAGGLAITIAGAPRDSTTAGANSAAAAGSGITIPLGPATPMHGDDPRATSALAAAGTVTATATATATATDSTTPARVASLSATQPIPSSALAAPQPPAFRRVLSNPNAPGAGGVTNTPPHMRVLRRMTGSHSRLAIVSGVNRLQPLQPIPTTSTAPALNVPGSGSPETLQQPPSPNGIGTAGPPSPLPLGHI